MKIIILKKSLNPLKTLRIPVSHLPSVIILTYYDMIILQNSYLYDLFMLDNLEIIAILDALVILVILGIIAILEITAIPENPTNLEILDIPEVPDYENTATVQGIASPKGEIISFPDIPEIIAFPDILGNLCWIGNLDNLDNIT